jgi:hypothetical protein
MKKEILVALAILPVATYAVDTADLSPGAVELSGGTTLRLASGSTKIKPESGTERKTDTGSYRLDTSGFYYVGPNVGLGLAVSYDKESEKTGSVSMDSWTFVVGPAIALHVPVASELALYGQGTVGRAWARSWGSGGTPDIGANGYAYAVEAGLKYFPVKQVSLQAGVVYEYLTLTTDEVNLGGPTPPGPVTIPKTDTTSSDLAFFVGLSVYFGR